MPYLGCVASETEAKDSLILTCVNRQLAHAETAEIDLSALPRTTGLMSVTLIAGENLLVENDEANPKRVVPVTTSESFETGRPFLHTFSKESVTLLQVGLAN